MNKHVWRYGRFLLPVLIIVIIIIPRLYGMIVEAASPPVFTEVTDAAGLYYRGETWGWAWGDYNDDGNIDLFLGNHPNLTEADDTTTSAFLRNDGDGTFTDVRQGSGISEGQDRHDHAWIDYDDEGDLDLWVTNAGGGLGAELPLANELYQNDGNGHFVDVAEAAGVDYPLGRARGSAWLDYDLDGDLDLYFTGAQRAEAPNAFFRNDGDGTFTNITSSLNLDAFLGSQSNVAVADYDNDGYPDMYVTGTETRLYHNVYDPAIPGRQFSDVASSALGFAGSAQSAAWGDYDNDGDPDLFITRGAQDYDHDYWEVSGAEIRFVGRSNGGDEDGLDFEVSGSVTFLLQEQAGGVARRLPQVVFLGDDGHHPDSIPFTLDASDISGSPPYTPTVSTGFFIWQSEAGEWRIRWTAAEAEPRYSFSGIITATTSYAEIVEVELEPIETYSLPNRLFRNQGDGTFVEVAAVAGVADSQDCRSADWGDYDNDGYLDLFVQAAGEYGSTNGPDLLYHNNGNATFANLAASAGVTGTDEGYGWGAAWADYDNDGFLDLLTSHESWPWPLDMGRYELFHNGGNENHWLEIDLRGLQSNSRGYGAKLWITAGGMTQFREVNDNSHYFQHYAGPVHLGLGDSTVVDELRVEWPSGVTDVLNDVPADQRLTIQEMETHPGSITVTKEVEGDGGATPSDWSFTITPDPNGVGSQSGPTAVFTDLPAGTYTINEDGPEGFSLAITGDCNSNGQVTLGPGEAKACTFTNSYAPFSVYLPLVVKNY